MSAGTMFVLAYGLIAVIAAYRMDRGIQKASDEGHPLEYSVAAQSTLVVLLSILWPIALVIALNTGRIRDALDRRDEERDKDDREED